MTRRRKNQRSITHRDIQKIASRRLVGTSNNYSVAKVPLTTNLRLIEDRRFWHPQGPKAPARSFRSSVHRIVEVPKKPRPVKPHKIKSFVPTSLAFDDPATLICVRRKVRREVMFARRKAGKRGQKRKTFSYYSSISCKRRK